MIKYKNLLAGLFFLFSSVKAIDLVDLRNIDLPDTIKIRVCDEYEKPCRFLEDAEINNTLFDTKINVLLYDTSGYLEKIKVIDSDGTTGIINVNYSKYDSLIKIRLWTNGYSEMESIKLDQNNRPIERNNYLNGIHTSTEIIDYSPEANFSKSEIKYHSAEYYGPESLKRYYTESGKIKKVFLHGEKYGTEVEMYRYTGNSIDRIVTYEFVHNFQLGLEKLRNYHKETQFIYVDGKNKKRLSKVKAGSSLNATITSMIICKLLMNKVAFEKKNNNY